MRSRVFGVAAVLLVLGALGGYVVAERTASEPRILGSAAPVPAVSPSAPVSEPPRIAPDPVSPPLRTDVATTNQTLRITPRGTGLSLDVPTGWQSNRLADSNSWNFAPPTDLKYTFLMRASILAGLRQSTPAAMSSRIVQLTQTEADGNITEFAVTAQASDYFEASYIDGEFRRLTVERFVSFDDSESAYAEIAVTGRVADLPGMRALVTSTAESLQPVAAEPKPVDDSPDGSPEPDQ